ncbi:MAG: glycosyl hydrolase 115 family protein [Bacteroidota bacterium]|nr:glycosyl hydrolase 115 family protein [Bacteroidota bacterium]
MRNFWAFWSCSIVLLFSSISIYAEQEHSYITNTESDNQFVLSDSTETPSLIVSSEDYPGVIRALKDLKADIGRVTGSEPEIKYSNTSNQKGIVIVGTIGKSPLVDQLVKNKKLDVKGVAGKWESFVIQTIQSPFPGVAKALVIAGSDKRGTIYGIYDVSKQIGVSPWYYWADVPVVKHKSLFVKDGRYVVESPKVKYRGIFLNDEAPALSGWAKEKFGGFNHQFYAHVFELVLRLRGNFMWPAMWGNAFFDDDKENGPLADEMGVVIGLSHHEPMGRSQAEWHRYGKGAWDYTKNDTVLKNFWQGGVERNKNWETLVTIGMRGDGDEPMSRESNISLLERIVKEQRGIINKVTGQKPEKTPQVWALYKEVQDYYDQGMRVPDDVTLLLCDDNWGNVRKLPDINAPVHPGGYGIYYHVDYVGGPRCYKWLNVSQIERIWEQMNLAYTHRADRLWILNVGDLKPMEYPISFFLDMAWDPTRFNAQNIQQYPVDWCAQQFGEKYAKDAARILKLYTKYNHRVTPELLDANTFSLDNYSEFERVRNDYRDLTLDAMRLYNLIPNSYKDAFDQLVLFPVNACSNLYEMYYAVAKNRKMAAQNDLEANYWADVALQCYNRDSILTIHYNKDIADGKWSHMMDQIHIGYRSWAEPRRRIMPKVTRVEVPEILMSDLAFDESDGFVSIEAEHFQKTKGTDKIHWNVIPELGKTVSAVSTFPQNQYPSSKDSVYVEYAINLKTTGTFDVNVLLSPTLNFNANKGLRYAISFDGGNEQIVNINQTYSPREIDSWQAKRINQTKTKHLITTAGIHRLRFRVLEPGIVLQKILIDTGGLKPSYLGAPESKLSKAKN